VKTREATSKIMELTSQMGEMQSKISKAESDNLSITEKLMVKKQLENKLKEELEELKQESKDLKYSNNKSKETI